MSADAPTASDAGAGQPESVADVARPNDVGNVPPPETARDAGRGRHAHELRAGQPAEVSGNDSAAHSDEDTAPASHLRGRADRPLDPTEKEYRRQAGLVEGRLLERTFCASVGGAEELGVPPADGRPRNQDRGGIVVDVRGRQVGVVFDLAECYSGYSCEHDGHWFADQVITEMKETAIADEGNDLRAVVERALIQVDKRHRDARCDKPSLTEHWGTMAVARLDGNEAELAVICDCKIAVRTEQGWELVEDPRMLAALQDERNPALHEAWKQRYVDGSITQAEFEPDFRKVFSPSTAKEGARDQQPFEVVTPDDPQCARNAIYKRVTVPPDSGIVLMTSDGVKLPIGDWGRTADVASRGAAAVIQAARAARGPSTNPEHPMKFPDMTAVELFPGDKPAWAKGHSTS